MHARERRKPAVWVVVPAYNEAGAIGNVLNGLAERLPHVVVVDDGSTDRTAEVALAHGATVVRHAVNLGQGAALQTGIDYALSRNAGHVCTFDADDQHDPSAIGDMLEALKTANAEVALGSRFLGQAPGMSVTRKVLLRAAVLFTRLQTGLRVSDAHNGLRVFTRRAAQKLDIRQPGMAHASEILGTVAQARLSYVEVPTTVRYTTYSLAKGQNLTNSVKILFDIVYAAWIR